MTSKLSPAIAWQVYNQLIPKFPRMYKPSTTITMLISMPIWRITLKTVNLKLHRGCS